MYARPRGFVRVTAENQDTWVSPHFQLKQFLCKQSGRFPKFLLLQERLLTKLELTLAKLNEKGIATPTLQIMSGYRTPAYNRSLRNVGKSRHLFGDAADVLVGDLNRDGKNNAKDAAFLRGIVAEVEADGHPVVLAGGVGLYSKTHTHGPFVHIDARGHRARWGVEPGSL
jgi:uncharacterized protein YcbK (DUF882 family)